MNIKNIFYTIIASILFCFNTLSYGNQLNQNSIDPNGKTIIKVGAGGGEESIKNFLVFIRDFLFGMLAIIVVGAFLYVGYLFVTARGKPEEFKKAWMHTIYIIVGIAIVSSAWGIVSLVAGIDI